MDVAKEMSMGGTTKRMCLTAGLLVATLWPGAALAATVTGTVVFDGKAPALKPLAMDAEPVCHKMHGGKPTPNEMLVLGGGNSMGNVIVWVSKGIPAGKT